MDPRRRGHQGVRTLSASGAARIVGRYELHGEIASGGMATVHLGRLEGPGGFAHTLAIKRLHAELARSPEFVAMLLDEARLAAHVQHANVVRVFDVFLHEGELFLVMEYVRGETLARLLALSRAAGPQPLPLATVLGIALGALAGLHAAHEARDATGRPLEIVHRDISPENLIVGVDGTTRILDFGIAKAVSRLQVSRAGQVKGKLSYMAPEQLREDVVDRRADVYAMGVVLWEMVTGRRLFEGTDRPRASGSPAPRPSSILDVPPALDAVVARALAVDRDARFATAREMALALEAVGTVEKARVIGEWVHGAAAAALGVQQAAMPASAPEETQAFVAAPAAAPVAAPAAAGSAASAAALVTVRAAPPVAARARVLLGVVVVLVLATLVFLLGRLSMGGGG